MAVAKVYILQGLCPCKMLGDLFFWWRSAPQKELYRNKKTLSRARQVLRTLDNVLLLQFRVLLFSPQTARQGKFHHISSSVVCRGFAHQKNDFGRGNVSPCRTRRQGFFLSLFAPAEVSLSENFIKRSELCQGQGQVLRTLDTIQNT